MLDWKKIDTVLLDMDGTLLDLHFDNYFWKEYIPLKFAEQQGLSLHTAKQELEPRFKSMEGQLMWYCLDYWAEALQLDIVSLKQEIAHLIAVLPHADEFLTQLRASARHVLLVTNAHRDSLSLKMEKTAIDHFFDGIVSSHDFGLPKEHQGFWTALEQLHNFDKQTTLLIDDSLTVLGAAQRFGIAHLVSISKPDSKQPARAIDTYLAIEDFRALMPVF